MQLLGMGDAEPADAFDKQKTVDPSTIATWSDIIQNDTENIGRIWTDKTVSSTSVQLPASPDGTAPSVDIGDSDFLVTLCPLPPIPPPRRASRSISFWCSTLRVRWTMS